MNLSYDEIIQILKLKLCISKWMMKIVSVLSGEKRCCAIITIYTDGITAEEFIAQLDKLMLESNREYQRVNLNACPDHYVLNPQNGILKVIETTGNNSLPTQFFITFNDELGLREPRNLSYSEQSVGVARLKDGTIIGGVRHQFKNTQTGMKARLFYQFSRRSITNEIQ